MKAIAARVGPSLVTFPSAAGKPAFGVLVSANGEVLASGTSLGEPGRTVAVTLADGKTVMARTKGIHRAADLGLLQLEGAGPGRSSKCSRRPLCQRNCSTPHVSATAGGDGKWTPAVRPVPVPPHHATHDLGRFRRLGRRGIGRAAGRRLRPRGRIGESPACGRNAARARGRLARRGRASARGEAW